MRDYRDHPPLDGLRALRSRVYRDSLAQARQCAEDFERLGSSDNLSPGLPAEPLEVPSRGMAASASSPDTDGMNTKDLYQELLAEVRAVAQRPDPFAENARRIEAQRLAAIERTRRERAERPVTLRIAGRN